MAYYLTIETKKGKYKPLDLRKSNLFTKMSRYTKDCAFSLQEIDFFTMYFNNELELRNYLVKENILETTETDKPLSIRQLYRSTYKKVMYDLFYQKDLEYITYPQTLIDHIVTRYYQQDYFFIEKLASTFQNYYECNQTASEIRNYASSKLNGYPCSSNYLEERDKNGDIAITRLLKLLIYKYVEYSNGKIYYVTNEIKYSNLHQIVAFMNHYDQKQLEKTTEIINNNKKENNYHQIGFGEFIETLEKEDVKVKTRTKKDDILYEQLSFYE